MNTVVQRFPEQGDFNRAARIEMAERIFADIRKLSEDGPGVSRESYGPGEQAAGNFSLPLRLSPSLRRK